MRIQSIKFRLSTSQLKCNNCKRRVIGKDGFVHIECGNDGGFFNMGMSNIRICWSCFKAFCKEIDEDRVNREVDYRELTKKAIIRNLK